MNAYLGTVHNHTFGGLIGATLAPALTFTVDSVMSEVTKPGSAVAEAAQ